MKAFPGMTASNTRACFRALKGERIVGLLFDACPAARPDLRAGNVTIVVEGGWGLTFNTQNGSYWLENADEIARATKRVANDLAATKDDLSEVLALAGLLSEEDA